MTSLDVRARHAARTTPLDPVPLDPADFPPLPEAAAFGRITTFFAPVISSETFVELVSR
jgi:hypothetical protein